VINQTVGGDQDRNGHEHSSPPEWWHAPLPPLKAGETGKRVPEHRRNDADNPSSCASAKLRERPPLHAIDDHCHQKKSSLPPKKQRPARRHRAFQGIEEVARLPAFAPSTRLTLVAPGLPLPALKISTPCARATRWPNGSAPRNSPATAAMRWAVQEINNGGARPSRTRFHRAEIANAPEVAVPPGYRVHSCHELRHLAWPGWI